MMSSGRLVVADTIEEFQNGLLIPLGGSAVKFSRVLGQPAHIITKVVLVRSEEGWMLSIWCDATHGALAT